MTAAKKKNKQVLSIRMTAKEQIWGFLYLIASLFVLPVLLSWLNQMLPVPLRSVWYNFVYFVINFCAVLGIFLGFFRRSWEYIGHNFPDFLLAVIVGFALYWASNWGISVAFDYLFPDFSNLNDGSVAAMAESNFLVCFIGTVLLVPLAEETLYRGLIFGSLYPKNHAAAYAVSAVVFAAIHLIGFLGTYHPLSLLLAFIQYLPAGLTLAWAYRKSGSIFAPILIHTVINLIGMFSLR